jgi:uncharacterized cupin superfamily protein
MSPTPAKKLDLSTVPVNEGTKYPGRFNHTRGDIAARRWQRVGVAAGLSHIGVNRVVLAPGAASSLRHWHTRDEEFVVVLEGEAVMITDDGETLMRVGDMAGFPAQHSNGHCFVNRTSSPAVLLAIGTRDEDDETHYSEVDLFAHSDRDGGGYVSRAGERYDDTP